MPPETPDLKQRTQLAREAIRASLGTEAGEYGADLFAAHHLEELEGAVWRAMLGTDEPEPTQVLDALILSPGSAGEGGGDLDRIDLALPGGVSDYVLCVSFDAHGAVEDISMES